jgi:hypothetical protein
MSDQEEDLSSLVKSQPIDAAILIMKVGAVTLLWERVMLAIASDL